MCGVRLSRHLKKEQELSAMRDFFDQQEVARRLSTRLTIILAISVVGTVAVTAAVLAGLATLLALLQVVVTTNFEVDPDYWIGAFTIRFWLASALVGTAVIGVAIYKTLQALESGGVEVARQLGAVRVLPLCDKPYYQQLINVVEELSVATGTPAPKIFVLEDEDDINAFAAGIEAEDTVVGVTRGALEHLDRAQLQGVLAHEFSHIVNGDVKINVQTLGALQGMEVINSAACFLLRMGISKRANGSMLATIFGSALWLVGQIGVFFGAIARMALNRQREYLADAAAVQFTRYPEGLSSALKLIAGKALQSEIRTAASASHFYFVASASGLDRLFASHPPLEMRIRRLDPEWDGSLSVLSPTQVAAFAEQPSDHLLDDQQELAERDAIAIDMPTCDSPPQSVVEVPVASCAVEEPEETNAGDPAVSDADKQALLATLAQVRSSTAGRAYDPNVTHWPTLAATAAALLVGVILFNWLISG
jgi:Zn-dependent protease with chaperone function